MAFLVGPHDERYEDFYTSWTKTQEIMLKDLENAIVSDMKEPELIQEVTKVAEHYEMYYKAKQSASHQDILQTMTPDWRSPLEKAFLWIGGWRPSLAFQLVYALSGQQIEAELAEFLEGVDSPTFASLTSLQLSKISELQTANHKQEENLSNEMAMLQQSFADDPLLSLAQAHKMVEALSPPHEGEAAHEEGGDDDGDELGNAMQEKLTTLQEIASQADVLRITTLRKVLDALDAYQKAEYLISAGKLQAALRIVGEKLVGTTAS